MIAKRAKHRVGKKRAGLFDKIVGEHILYHRHEAGASQTALGDAIGVSFQQVQKYENGNNRVSLAVFVLIGKWMEKNGQGSATELLADIMREVDGR